MPTEEEMQQEIEERAQEYANQLVIKTAGRKLMEALQSGRWYHRMMAKFLWKSFNG